MVQPINFLQNLDTAPLRTFTSNINALQQNQQNANLLQQQEFQQQQQQQQVEAQAAQEKLGQEFGADLQAFYKNGDTLGLITKYPQFRDRIQQQSDFRQTLIDNDAGRVASQMFNSLDRGDTASAFALLEANREKMNNLGDPNFTADAFRQMIVEDPEQAKALAKSTAELTGVNTGGLNSKDEARRELEELKIRARSELVEQKGKVKQKTTSAIEEERQKNRLAELDRKTNKQLELIRERSAVASDSIARDTVNKVVSEGNAKRALEFIGNGEDAVQTVKTLENLKRLNAKVKSAGYKAVTGAVTDFLGTTPTDEGLFRAESRRFLLPLIKSLGSNPTEGERAFIESILPKIEGGSQEINDKIIDRFLREAHTQVRRGELARENLRKITDSGVVEPLTTTVAQETAGLPVNQFPAQQPEQFSFQNFPNAPQNIVQILQRRLDSGSATPEQVQEYLQSKYAN